MSRELEPKNINESRVSLLELARPFVEGLGRFTEKALEVSANASLMLLVWPAVVVSLLIYYGDRAERKLAKK